LIRASVAFWCASLGLALLLFLAERLELAG
jgi:hypothetical protein